jgi:hypothetical protein
MRPMRLIRPRAASVCIGVSVDPGAAMDAISADRARMPAKAPEVFAFEDFFLGAVGGSGFIEDRRGRVRRAFAVEMHGYWSGSDFILDELFRFRDGEAQRRSWRVTCGGGGRYWAAADDLVGFAEGTAGPRSIRWRYRLLVPIGRRKLAFAFDDRMHLMDDGTVLDISDMRKFGIRVGWLVLALARRR